MSNKYKHNIHTEYSRALELKKAAFVISVVIHTYFQQREQKEEHPYTAVFL